ncbi:MAG: hypothetical protein WCF23_14485 [Candidatus Nitrosopolaris sp.]
MWTKELEFNKPNFRLVIVTKTIAQTRRGTIVLVTNIISAVSSVIFLKNYLIIISFGFVAP